MPYSRSPSICLDMSYQDTLKNILNFARCMSTKSMPKQSPQQPTPTPLFILPQPESRSRAKSVAASDFPTALASSAQEIRAAHESVLHSTGRHHSACDVVRLSNQLKNVDSFLEKKYHEQLRVAELRGSHNRAKSRPVFNQEFVPLLEKYFEYNAYPSAPDRVVLARKSMMTPRQIEVWFQNHRNRARKEGKDLRRLFSNPLPVQLSITSLEETMPFFVIPEHERGRKERTPIHASNAQYGDEDDRQPSGKTIEKETCGALVHDLLPHVFPMIYPPSCDYDPFPCKTGKYSLPTPVWTRRPATSCPPRSIPSFDDFVAEFATKLIIRDISSKQQSQISSSTAKRRPWFSATHTTPPAAPHPALIRPFSLPLFSNSLSPLPTVSAPPSRRHPFWSPGPCSRLTSLVHPAQRGTLIRRKVAHLPRWTPKNESQAHHQPSSTPIVSPIPETSRNLSSSSIASSSRRLSSSSSSSSSRPSTPTSSPRSESVQLPYVAESQSDFQHEGGTFVDFVNHPFSPMLQCHVDTTYTPKYPYPGNHSSLSQYALEEVGAFHSA